MLNLSPTIRIFLHTQPTNPRKSFDAQAAFVKGIKGWSTGRSSNEWAVSSWKLCLYLLAL